MSSAEPAPRTLLNVDDNVMLRYAKSRVLRQAGYEVLEAGTGEEALQLAASRQPSLIVLDVNLPGIDGLEVCRRIKQDMATAHMMVLHVTAEERYKLACLDGGGDACLIEPMDPSELVATVRALLRLSDRQAENQRLREQLCHAERKFSESAEAADCGTWDWDVRTGRLEWSGALERLAGIRPGSFSEKIETFKHSLHEDDQRRVWDCLQDSMARREERFFDEYRFVHPDGTVHWMSATGRFFYDQSGQAIRMTGVMQDITERKQAEDRLRRQSERGHLLARAAEALLTTEHPHQLMAEVFETVRQHLELDGYFHYRVTGAVPALVLEGCAGVPDDAMPQFRELHFGQALCGATAQRTVPVIYERLHESPDEKVEALKALGFRAYACHPLMVSDRLLGTLSFASKTRHRFEPDEVAFMQDLSCYVAAAMDRLRLEAETKDHAERLRQSEDHLRAAMDLNPQMPWTAGPDGSFADINERWFQFSGLAREDALDEAWRRVQHEADLPRMMAAWTHSVQTGDAYDIEHRLRTASGEYRWMRSRAFPRRDRQGRIVRWYGTTEDIHDRTLAQEALRDSRVRLQEALQFREAVMANINEGIYTLDSGGLVTYVNPAAEALLGWTSAELLGRKMHPLIHYRHRDGTAFPAEACAGRQVLRQGATLVEHADVFIRKDGTFFDVVYSSAPLWSDGTIAGLVLVFRDVSEQHVAEQALRANEERFRTMAQAVPSFLFETDAEGGNIWTSDGWCQFTGQTQEEVRGHGWANALHPDDRAANIDRWVACMRDGVPFESRQRLRRGDGSYAWVVAKALPVRDERGAVSRWLGSVTDVDELARQEEALRESEERFRQIAETADCVFWMTERSPERVLYVSPAFERIWQRPASALYRNAREWSDAISPEDRGRVLQAYERWLADCDRQAFDVEYRIVRPDGTVRWIADEGRAVRDGEGRVYRLSGIARDITVMKAAEGALRESEERLKLAFEVGRIGHWEWDARRNHIVWSDQLVAMYGVGPEDFGGTYQGFLGRIHEEDRDLIQRAVRDAISTRGDYEAEFRFVRKDGSVRWSLTKGRVHCDADGSVMRLNGVDMDITERKQAEERLTEQARLDAFTGRIGKHLVESHDVAGMLQNCTQTMVDHLGAAFARVWILNEQDDVLELRASSGLYTNLDGRHARVPMGSSKIWLIAAQRQPNLTNHVLGDPRIPEQEWVRREGLVAFAGYPLIIEDRVIGVMAMFFRQALSESTIQAMAVVADQIALGIMRKQAEEALRESEERLLAALKGAGAGTFRWNIRTNELEWDEELDRLFGLPPGQNVRSLEAFLDRVHPEERPGVLERCRRCAEDGADFDMEFRIVWPDGSFHWLDDKGKTCRDEAGRPAYMTGACVDITQRKLHEEQLRRWKDELEERVVERTQELVASQGRLRALASQLSLAEQRERRKLAGDLHDYLAQLLVVGRMRMMQMARQPALPAAAQDMVRDADSLLQQALSYTRTMIADLCPPSLHEAGLPAALRWLAERMHKDGLWVEVCSDREHLPLPEDQAVLLFYSVRELLFNVLKHAGVDRATVRLCIARGDVRVTVDDRGKGLDPRDLARSVEPGHLGLFGVRERMEAIGGYMEVSSAPGEGTAVTMVLPQSAR